MDLPGFRLNRAPTNSGSLEVRLELSGILDAEVQAGCGVCHLILDMSGLNYSSSTGIGALITSTQRLRRIGVDLVLLDTPPHIRHIVDLLGFSPSLDFRQSAG